MITIDYDAEGDILRIPLASTPSRALMRELADGVLVETDAETHGVTAIEVWNLVARSAGGESLDVPALLGRIEVQAAAPIRAAS